MNGTRGKSTLQSTDNYFRSEPGTMSASINTEHGHDLLFVSVASPDNSIFICCNNTLYLVYIIHQRPIMAHSNG